MKFGIAVDSSELDSVLALEPEVDSSLVLPRDFSETFCPFEPLLDTARIGETMVCPAETVSASVPVVAERPDWDSGLVPEPRAVRPGNYSGFLLSLTVLFVVMALNFRYLKRLLGVYKDELLNVRHGRDNVFDDRPAGDFRVLVLLILLSVVGEGILLASGVGSIVGMDGGSATVGNVVRLVALSGVYYLFELTAYQTVGYTFATGDGRREWIRGFNASQALLGVGLSLPAIAVTFYPSMSAVMSLWGLVVYMVVRILFIIKGFRIFYDKMTSFLYFILYLCTLEIIPVILVYKISVMELS